jgi:serine/threonine protein kinase
MTTMLAEMDVPREVEEYRIIRLLGSGSMGRVYLAEDRLLERLVAIKFVAGATPTEHARVRFFKEARAVARLSHPNVVAIHRVSPSVPTSLETVPPRYLCTDGRRMVPETCPSHPKF